MKRYCGNSRKSFQGGFTLIELMVVAAVIMVLLTILSPTMHRAVARARQTKCLGNLRVQGIGMMGYTMERGYYPGASERSTSGRVVAAWVTRSRHYIDGSTHVFVCPSLPEEYRWTVRYGTGSAFASTDPYSRDVKELFYEPGELLIHSQVPFSYGYNDWGTFAAFGIGNRDFGLGGDLWGWPQTRTDQVVRPSEMIAVTDMRATGSWDHIADPTNPWEVPAANHLGGTNVLMADGSAEWIEWNKLVHINKQQADGIAMRRRWNRDNEPHVNYGPSTCICEKCSPRGWWQVQTTR